VTLKFEQFMTPSANIHDYFTRIQFSGDFAPNWEVLRQLHVAHSTHIPFENIDVLLGRTISLELSALEDKLVRHRRGGYCFEQNGLFAAVLEQIGFSITRLGARVRLGGSNCGPRTHMLLKVDIEGQTFIADVGFGGASFLEPIPLLAGPTFEICGWNHRLSRERHYWVLATQIDNSWVDLYAFTLEEQFAADYEVANYFTSTSPTSHFRQIVIAQAQRTDVRYSLHNSKLVEAHGSNRRTVRTLTEAEIPGVLNSLFGIELPPGTRIPIAPSRQQSP
jgi:N-hydroxyarylamine O-acetyltransferase